MFNKVRKFIVTATTISVLVSCITLSFGADTAAASSSSKSAEWPTYKWSVSSPNEQGIDSNKLSLVEKRIKDNYPNIYSLLVVRHGFLVYEKYYNGMNKDNYNPVYSISKSVMSALTGIALREKLFTSIDQKVSEFFPKYFTGIDNPAKNDITLKNVLTMSAGLTSIDLNYNGYFSSKDWLDYTIKQPLIYTPGTHFTYNTGLTHFLSAIITDKSKMSTLDFANKFLFNMMGITVHNWDKDPLGYYGGGSGLYLTPSDMAKFGLLYLENGMWDKNQLIPRDWVAQSVKKQIAGSIPTDPNYGDYGYLFWVKSMNDKANNKTFETYRADGKGGQKIVVIPSLDMVVVVTANMNAASKDGTDTLSIVPDYILPAVVDYNNNSASLISPSKSESVKSSASSSNNNKNKVVVKSSDGSISVTVPNGWNTNDKSFFPTSVLGVSNSKNNLYVFVTKRAKTGLVGRLSLQTYLGGVKSAILSYLSGKITNPVWGEPKAIKIDGYDGLSVQLDVKKTDKTDMVYWINVINGKNSFYNLYEFTTKSNTKVNKPIMDEVINSFTEIK